MTKKSAARVKTLFPKATAEWVAGSANRKPGLFGTLFQPIARWWCNAGTCDAANISKLLPPLKEREMVACRKCHRLTTLTLEVSKLPQCWGGPVADTETPTAEVKTEAHSDVLGRP